ncbi:MAG TPA: hypothetical protein VFP98_02730 [Candidatus Polarisedimenticolia bacterium]|nr:hypothetical protein [Candidatus Polarisedimenticolia bacterium]
MTTLTREAAIRAIRAMLMAMTDEEHSMCRVASEKGIYCKGFAKFSDEELRQRYNWLLRKNPQMSREQLEDLANRWQIARQIVDQVPISCDAQTIEHDTCAGWDGFDNAAIARFHQELGGGPIEVVS